MAAGPSEDSEYMEEEAAVKLMLVVLSQDAIQGFYQQVNLLSCLLACCHGDKHGLAAPMHQSKPISSAPLQQQLCRLILLYWCEVLWQNKYLCARALNIIINDYTLQHMC